MDGRKKRAADGRDELRELWSEFLINYGHEKLQIPAESGDPGFEGSIFSVLILKMC